MSALAPIENDVVLFSVGVFYEKIYFIYLSHI